MGEVIELASRRRRRYDERALDRLLAELETSRRARASAAAARRSRSGARARGGVVVSFPLEAR